MAVFVAESLVLNLTLVPIATSPDPTRVCPVTPVAVTVVAPAEDPKLITLQSML